MKPINTLIVDHTSLFFAESTIKFYLFIYLLLANMAAEVLSIYNRLFYLPFPLYCLRRHLKSLI